MDHVVVVLFENRTLHNVLAHLNGFEDGKTFEGVVGKEFSNPICRSPTVSGNRSVSVETRARD